MFKFNKNNSEKERQKFFNDNMSLFNPPSAFNGYAIEDDSEENLRNIFRVLCKSSVDLDKVDWEGKNAFVDSLEELNYVTGDFQQHYSLDEMVDGINVVAKKLNYDIKLTKDDVLQFDDETIKKARLDFYLTYHDLNICAELLAKQGYELFQVFIDVGGYYMSLLPKDEIEILKQYTE